MHSRSIVLVCTGNQCRSPMAEHLLKRRLGPNSNWKVLSAGTAAIAGLPASRLAVEVMAGIGVDISAHSSRPVTGELMDSAAIVITMTRSQRDEITARFPRALDKVFTLGSIAGDPLDRDVADPVGMTVADYRRTRDEIDEMMPDVLLFLREQE